MAQRRRQHSDDGDPSHQTNAARSTPVTRSTPETYRLINLEQFERNFLQCPICLETFDELEKSPKLLPCAHDICLTCLTQVFQNSPRDTTVWSDQVITKRVKCPSCRYEIVVTEDELCELPNDHRLTNMKEFLYQAPGAFSPNMSRMTSQNENEQQPTPRGSAPNMPRVISRNENIQQSSTAVSSPNMSQMTSGNNSAVQRPVNNNTQEGRIHGNRSTSVNHERPQDTPLHQEELRKFQQALECTRRLREMENRRRSSGQLESARRLQELQQNRTQEQVDESIKQLNEFINKQSAQQAGQNYTAIHN